MRRDGSKPRLEIVRVDPAPNPQAQRPFRMLDQVNALVDAREADPDIGFMARLLMLCSLPRTNPGDRDKYVRKNGPFTLVMFAGANQKLPFGNLPRLMLAWISTEAVRTQNRELVLGDSLADFMRALGIYSNSGRVHIRLKNQMERLFQCHVQLVHEHEHGKRFVSSQIADQGEFWWCRAPTRRAVVVGKQDRVGREILQRGHPSSSPAGYEHPEGAEAIALRPRPVHVAHVSNVLVKGSEAAVMADTSTGNSVWIRPRRVTTAPSRISARTASGS